MTTQEQQLIKGSLVVIAQKFEILPKRAEKRTSEKVFQKTTKRAELRSHVDLMNKMYNENGGSCYYEIDEEATLIYFNKKSVINELEVLQDSYREKFGEEPKKIWGVKKLTELING